MADRTAPTAARTYRCCVCCEDAKSDHVAYGGTVEKDGHDLPCNTCEPRRAVPAPTGDVPDEVSADVTRYVLGFAFDETGRVALIRKNRPAWQAGLLNGIGGHIEPGEHADDAVRREFREETGTTLDGWELFAVLHFPGGLLHCYRLPVNAATLDGLRTTTDEEVVVAGFHDLPAEAMIGNLTWLIPLATYTGDRYEPIQVHAQTAVVTQRVPDPATA